MSVPVLAKTFDRDGRERIFFGGAIAHDKRPEVHKRLVLATNVALVFAAVARMQIASPAMFFLVWVSPMLVGMAFDLSMQRHVHAVYLISVSAMALAFIRIFFMESEGWLRIGRVLYRHS